MALSLIVDSVLPPSDVTLLGKPSSHGGIQLHVKTRHIKLTACRQPWEVIRSFHPWRECVRIWGRRLVEFNFNTSLKIILRGLRFITQHIVKEGKSF